ncbi:S-adenosyl-L-methionine-dependent methyltransferase [Clavulina sp. PMI_390]|nr:S-adenosyl-L-methionine-dependent methyltransferase [Clavulina sp. PMI_390]
MLERFQDIKRDFTRVLDLGSGSGQFTKLLPPKDNMTVRMLDMSPGALYRDPTTDFEVAIERSQGDEEQLLASIQPNSLDAVVSCLALHWVNDLPGALVQIKEALKPDGVFMGAMIGGDTLFELRTALQVAEVEREGGISPRVSPMTDTRDVSNLLGRAGFTLLTVDIDDVEVMYPSMWELVEDLRYMGESNAIVDRRTFLHRDTLLATSAAYEALHKKDGGIPATFQIIFMIGWKPGPNQPKPLPRGSGELNLKDVL